MQDTTEREANNLLSRFGPAILIVAVFLIGILMIISVPKKGDVIVYDCQLSEISPDFPPSVREQCRKVRAENFKENLQKPK